MTPRFKVFGVYINEEIGLGVVEETLHARGSWWITRLPCEKFQNKFLDCELTCILQNF